MGPAKLRRSLTFMVLGIAAVAVPGAERVARAQGLLELVDGNNFYFGPIVSIQKEAGVEDYSRIVQFLYEWNGASALLSATSPFNITNCAGNTFFYAYYESPSCNGTPAVVEVADAQTCQFFPLVLPDSTSDNLWEVHLDQPVEVLVAGNRTLGRTGSGTPCVPETPHSVAGYAASLWGTLRPKGNEFPGWAYPLRVRRNPFIFGDDFGSMNLEAWSPSSN